MGTFAPLVRKPVPRASSAREKAEQASRQGQAGTEPPRAGPPAPDLRDSSRARLDDIANRAVAAASGLAMLQRQPTVGATHTPAETEAERAADGNGALPVAMPTALRSVTPHAPALIGKTRQRIAAGLAGGRPLPIDVRNTFEPALGLDLGPVRVHDDAAAGDAARSLRARAFTLGRDVVFGAGEYAPSTPGGKRLLAHELTHVAQQATLRGEARPVIQRADDPAHDLISQFTSLLGNLDEEGLGAELVRRAAARAYDAVQNVIDDLGSTDRDDVSLAFMEAASDALLGQIVSDERGRRLLDRLYDELTSGSVADDEQKQANRILKVKSSRIGAADLERIASGGAVKIFPFRIPGPTVLNDAPISAERRPDGGVHVKIPVHTLGTDEFKQETSTLPSEVAVSGITLPENEIVGVKLYDLGGPIKYAPALFLVELSNQTDTKVLEKAVGVAAIGLTLGAGALAGLGVEASVGARLLLFADRAALAIGALGIVIDDHRGLILSRFGAQGAEFLRVWDIVESAVALYGLARVAVTAPKLISALRNAFRSWRAVAAGVGGLGEDDLAVLAKINQATEGILNDTDALQAEAKPTPPANPASPPPGTDPAQAAPPEATRPTSPPAEAHVEPQRPTEPPPRPAPAAVPAVEFGHEPGYHSDRIFRDWLNHEIPSEGWKIHVSADAASAHAVADSVLPLLRKMGVNHKVVGTVQALERMGGTQAGKFITIYPDSTAHAKAIADAVDGALAGRGLSGPGISGERAIGGSNLVYTRYGGFTKSTVTSPQGAEVPDTRGQIKPPWVEDPWQQTPAGGTTPVKPGPGQGSPRE